MILGGGFLAASYHSNPCPAKQMRGFEHGQSDDTRVTARDLLDEHATLALDGVRPGFIEGFSTLPVCARFVRIDVSKSYRRRRDNGPHLAAVPYGNTGHHLMGAGRKPTEHVQCVGLVHRFAEHVIVQHNGRVRADNDVAGSRRPGQSLVPRKAHYHFSRRLTGEASLVNIGAASAEFET
jgi:hypothetical protein